MTWSFLDRRAKHRQTSPFEALRIALIADDLTCAALDHECRVRNVTPRNHRGVLRDWRPDLLLVESAWRGRRDAWRYGIASYPDHPGRTNAKLAAVVSYARDVGIPTVFWNREDGVHFDRFIDSARLFDRVLTVDDTMVPAYREALGPDARVGTMMFAASRALHFPTWEPPRDRAVFVGSYSAHLHDRRRAWQDMVFEETRPLGLTVFDRNSKRRPAHYRFPVRPWIETLPAVPHDRTPAIYRGHLVNLNVNTITGSTTAFSRRLVEVLACGGFALSNVTEAVRAHFADFCHATDDPGEVREFFARVSTQGLSAREQEMRRAAHDHVHRHHSWTSRLPIILEMAGA